MRQGSAKHVTSVKVEPTPSSINVRAVSQIGQALGNHATDSTTIHNPAEPMHLGRGFSAPHDSGKTVHHGGTNRRHD